jgi:hypothetical protein
MTDLYGDDDHATPLKPQEREELIPAHITLPEQQNIAASGQLLFKGRAMHGHFRVTDHTWIS